MRKFNRRILMALLLSFVAGLSLAVWAGPVLPGGKSRLSPGIRSLADIERLRLEIRGDDDQLEALGVKQTELLESCRERLLKAGFELSTEPGDPLLRFHLMHLDDDDIENAAMYICIVTVHQPVTLRSTKEELTVPTYVTVGAALEPNDQLTESVEATVYDLLSLFVTTQRSAAADKRARS